MLATYFPGNAATLDAARANSLALIPDGMAKLNGIAVGEAAAVAMIALRANGGSGTAMPYTPLTGPGFWQPTPPAFGPAILRAGSHYVGSIKKALPGDPWSSPV